MKLKVGNFGPWIAVCVYVCINIFYDNHNTYLFSGKLRIKDIFSHLIFGPL